MKLFLTAITLTAFTTSVAAQWLNHPTDPAAYTKPFTFTVNFGIGADTEMLEAVCEQRSDWLGKVSDVLGRGSRKVVRLLFRDDDFPFAVPPIWR